MPKLTYNALYFSKDGPAVAPNEVWTLIDKAYRVSGVKPVRNLALGFGPQQVGNSLEHMDQENGEGLLIPYAITLIPNRLLSPLISAIAAEVTPKI